jgi:hypothetical protein
VQGLLPPTTQQYFRRTPREYDLGK